MKAKIDFNEFIRFLLVLFGFIILSLLLGAIGVNKEDNILLYIIGVLLIATITHGYFYGILASIISMLCYNYFFTIPIYNFHMSDTSDVMLLFFFIVTSLIGCNLTNRFQQQLVISRDNEKLMNDLYQLSEKLLNITNVDTILKVGKQYLKDSIQVDVEIELEEKPSCNDNYPITSLNHTIGYIIPLNTQPLSEHDILMIKAVSNELGSVLEREFTYLEQEKIKLEMEKEHMTNSMLRSISHDLRTPLTGIAGASQLIYNRSQNEDIRILSKDINEQANWLSQLVENILNMSKIENGNLVLNKNLELIDDLIQEAIRLRPEIINRNIIVNNTNELLLINVDGKLIVQVLVNLLDNAIKYTQKNDTITISVEKLEKETKISVEDTGTGIDDDKIDTIFDEFVTYPGISVDSKKGIGIGLAICKAIIELHGGHIYATNTPQHGALFYFTLPNESEVDIDE